MSTLLAMGAILASMPQTADVDPKKKVGAMIHLMSSKQPGAAGERPTEKTAADHKRDRRSGRRTARGDGRLSAKAYLSDVRGAPRFRPGSFRQISYSPAKRGGPDRCVPVLCQTFVKHGEGDRATRHVERGHV